MKNCILNVSLLICTTVVSLLLIEVFLALFSPQEILIASPPASFFIEYDSEIGWKNRAGAGGVYQPTPFMEAVNVRINKYGMRGGEVNLKRPDNAKRIMVLGDSNTFGYGVREEERFSDRLSGFLSGGYEVLNCGVFGYGTDQELLLFEGNVLAFKPDIVVLAFSPGDVSDNMNSINTGSSKPYYKLEDGEPVIKNVPVPRATNFRRSGSRNSRIKKILYFNSNIYRLIFNRLLATNIFAKESVQEMTLDEGMMITTALINKMDKLSKENGAIFVVLLVPHGQWIESSNGTSKAGVGYYPMIKAVLSESGINVIDSTQLLLRRFWSGESVFLKKDPVHLSRQGNKAVAEVLHQWVIDSASVGPTPTVTN